MIFKKEEFMATFFAGNSLWQLVRQVDTISTVVLIVLFFMSVTCWAIFLCKFALFHLKKRQLTKMNSAIKKVRNIQGLLNLVTEYNSTTLPGYFLSKNLSFLQSLLGDEGSLQIHERELMQQQLEQTVDIIIVHEESYLPFLSTSAAVAPLLGLFGTVWGLIHAFMRISEKQVADITTVAPGIAEALVTTLAGLFVAIPALIMFNYLNIQLRKIEQELFVIADAVNFLVQRHVGQ